ncbi:MAG: sensor histidine kinase [Anaerolineae bacterium]|jgi:signal transduction histidine kinase|nr:sensor histidine kinase [Anaerolineae bacterium]
MLAQESQLLFLIVFFVYGLAFFVMGIALFLEASRSPSLAEAQLLLPLALFGILHGLHEWFELFLEQASWMETQITEDVFIIRLVFLAISFLSLGFYGFLASRLQKRETLFRLRLPLITLGFYFAIIIFSAITAYKSLPLDTPSLANNLIRYLLAVPAAVLASIGLRIQAKEAQKDKRFPLVSNLNWASFGFGLYGFSQLFVSPLAVFPATLLNNQNFFLLTGIPPEVIRSITALIITFGLVRAIQAIEVERQEQFQIAQEARVDALERVKEEMDAREDMRRELLRHIVQAQEDERARISRELHDETAQVLSAFSLELAALNNILDEEQSDLVPNLARLQDLSRDMSQGIFRLVHDLRPAQLDDLGLVPAIQNLIGQECCKMDLKVSLNIEGKSQRIDPLIETVLFRVAQASLTNIARHAETEKAEVKIRFNKNQVALNIIDEGIGFDPAEPFSPPAGWGLAGMRERVESVGGKFNLESSPGNGTSVAVLIPCNKKEE